MSYYESKLSALYADIDHEDGCAYPNYCNGELRKTSRLDELEKEMQRKEVPETSPPGAPSDKELSQKEKEVFSSLSGLNDVVVPGSSSSSSSASASANSSSKEKDRAPIHFIYSVGCFDLFHYGHKILFSRMRRFGGEGCKLVIGVHDDLSIYKLKAKWPIDPLEKRLANVAKYADRAFVIPSTDPTPYLAAIIDKKVSVVFFPFLSSLFVVHGSPVRFFCFFSRYFFCKRLEERPCMDGHSFYSFCIVCVCFVKARRNERALNPKAFLHSWDSLSLSPSTSRCSGHHPLRTISTTTKAENEEEEKRRGRTVRKKRRSWITKQRSLCT
ncbi:Cytidyltransferase [Balamuthia mandrillaris]